MKKYKDYCVDITMYVPDQETHRNFTEYSDNYKEYDGGVDYYDGGEYHYKDYYASNENNMDSSEHSSCLAQNEYDDYEVAHETYQMVAFFCDFQNYSAPHLNEQTVTVDTNATRQNFEFPEASEVEVSNRSIPLKSRNVNFILFLITTLYLT